VKLRDDARASRLIRGALKQYSEILNKQVRIYIDPEPLLLFWEKPEVSSSKSLQECQRRRENKGLLLRLKNGKALSPQQISQHISYHIINTGITAPLKRYTLNILVYLRQEHQASIKTRSTFTLDGL
ncbi:MAG: hypothetical protein EZS28_043991, partial [Streblomastix strix]